MSNRIIINKTLKPFDKIIEIEGDKSLSIRCALLASQANGKSKITNLLKSEDVLNTISSLKKLGIISRFNKNKCEIFGLGLNGYFFQKNLILNTGNSGTLARLIIGLLIHSKEKINYSKYRLIVFLLGFFLIVFSESTLRFVNNYFYNNLVIILIPIISAIFLYFYFRFKFNFNKILK